jgi:nitrogen regulatory protein P-II 1
MKLVTAVVRPQRLDLVKDALKQAGVHGLTMSEVKGFGAQGGYTDIYRGSEVVVDSIPKAQVQTVVRDEELDRVVAVIVAAARSGKEGKEGDGKIWITEVHHVVRIRTGETDLAAV